MQLPSECSIVHVILCSIVYTRVQFTQLLHGVCKNGKLEWLLHGSVECYQMSTGISIPHSNHHWYSDCNHNGIFA